MLETTTPEAVIEDAVLAIAENFRRLAAEASSVARAADLLVGALRGGGKVMFCGNGGSAADAQHLAAELMGRFLRDRAPLAAVALTVDTSALTAIGNDYSFDEVFARQIRGLGRPGDALVAISTSGNSANVLEALAVARAAGIATVGLTGASGGRMAELCDLCIRVPAARTDRIQEMHIAVGHLICGLVEDALC
ncbi:MAG TPA: D-sedoheptulose 7-phosphate isomerase [Arenibaculum sp.]|jgi:D-sedoheptulose 7-phosphate isomerase|nr:D-sedoheptulose 7-phosphate isomerase [Arenibaculum sp.]